MSKERRRLEQSIEDEIELAADNSDAETAFIQQAGQLGDFAQAVLEGLGDNVRIEYEDDCPVFVFEGDTTESGATRPPNQDEPTE